MAVGYNPRMVTNGLVLCLDAGNRRSYPGSGTTWTDLSGNGNNGTLSSTTYSSTNGGTLVFDGLNSISDHGTSSLLNLTTALTLDVWFYATSYGEQAIGQGRLIDRSAAATAGYMFFLLNDSGTIQNGFSYSLDNATNFISQSSTVSLNTWTNLVITHAGGTANAYKNGSFLQTKAIPQPSSSSTNLYIGNRAALDRTFAGNIPLVKIYNRALSAAEIRQNFNAIRGRYGI